MSVVIPPCSSLFRYVWILSSCAMTSQFGNRYIMITDFIFQVICCLPHPGTFYKWHPKGKYCYYLVSAYKLKSNMTISNCNDVLRRSRAVSVLVDVPWSVLRTWELRRSVLV